MPEVGIDYQNANDRYPEVVGVIMSKLRRGTRKFGKSGADRLRYQNAKPERLKWELVWSHKPEQLLEDDGKELIERTVEEEVERQLALVKMPVLRATIGEWTGEAILGIMHGIPDEVRTKEDTSVQFRHASATRWAAMTPEEKAVDRVTEALTAELTKKKGSEIRRKARALFGKAFKDFGLEAAAMNMDDPKEMLDDLEEAVKEFLEEYAADWTEA
jgi:hypothetical protein